MIASNEIDLPACDPKIFEHGDYIAILDAEPMLAEKWVRTVAKQAKAQIDWHYFRNLVHVLHLGSAESRARVDLVVDKLPRALKRKILKLLV